MDKNTRVVWQYLLPQDLPNPGIEPPSLISPALAGRFFTKSVSFVVKHDPEYNSSSEFCESFQEFVNLRMYWGSFHNTLPPMEGLSLQLVFTTTPINTLHLQVDYLATKLGLFFPAHKTFSF